MIKNVKELREYTKDIVDDDPEEAEDILITYPGISNDEVEKIKVQLPGMSEEYLALVNKNNLFGKRLALFILWPEVYGMNNMTDSLLQAYSEQNPHFEMMKKRNIYQVGFWEADPLFVSGKDGQESNVYRLSMSKPENLPIILNGYFEELLVLAGNIDQISIDDDIEDKLKAFEKVLTSIDFSGDKEQWMMIATVAFS